MQTRWAVLLSPKYRWARGIDQAIAAATPSFVLVGSSRQRCKWQARHASNQVTSVRAFSKVPPTKSRCGVFARAGSDRIGRVRPAAWRGPRPAGQTFLLGRIDRDALRTDRTRMPLVGPPRDASRSTRRRFDYRSGDERLFGGIFIRCSRNQHADIPHRFRPSRCDPVLSGGSWTSGYSLSSAHPGPPWASHDPGRNDDRDAMMKRAPEETGPPASPDHDAKQHANGS